MTVSWIKLKEELIKAVRTEMSPASNPPIIDLEETVEWFGIILRYNCGIKDLDGINTTIISTLEDLYVSRMEWSPPLRILASEVETFLEKIIYITQGNDLTSNKSKTFINMVDDLELSPIIKNRPKPAGEYLTEDRIIEFHRNPNFEEHICRSYKKRNDIIHNSPVYDIAEAFMISKSFLIVMLFTVAKYLDVLKSNINEDLENVKSPKESMVIDKKTEVLYNFLSHADSTKEIKEQIIDAFCLHSIYSNDSISLKSISQSCNEQFATNFTDNYFNKRVAKLVEEGRLDNSPNSPNSLKLSDSEYNKMTQRISRFQTEELLFKQNIKIALTKYHLEEKIDGVYHSLNKLIEKNYRINLDEIFDSIMNSEGINFVVQEFYKYVQGLLQSRGIRDEDSINELVFELLYICQNNDFLYKKCATIIFSDLSNQNGLQSYVRQQKRELFLDTNVLLYVICKHYIDIYKCEISEYDVCKDLIDYVKRNDKLKLFTSEQYLRELAFQVRSALLLIPFEEVDFFTDDYSTNNVFYNFYKYLQRTEKLEYDIENFEDFMAELDFSYDDLYITNPLNQIAKLCEDILYKEGVNIIGFDNYDTANLFEQISLIVDGKRKDRTIANDSQMLAFLSDRREHELEPYFITADTVFYKMRKYVIDNVRPYQFWHLYSPARIVAHLNFINFKIDAKNFNSDFMSILFSNSKITEETNYLADIMSDFLNIRSENKRKLIKMLKNFNIKYLLKIQSSNKNEKATINPVGELLRHISYSCKRDKTKNHLINVKRYMLDDENTEELEILFDEELKYFVKNKIFKEDLIQRIDELMKN